MANTTNISLKYNRYKGFRGLLLNIREHPVLYLMAVPVIVYFLVFHYAPMYGVIIAFKNYVPARGIMGSKWVGLTHFQNFFNDMYFGRLVRNTLVINLKLLIFGFPIPILFAVLLNEIRFKNFTSEEQNIKKFIDEVKYNEGDKHI